MPEIFDDKSEHCIPFLLDRVKAHQARYGAASDPTHAPPLFLGLNGVQGAGKTVLVASPCPLSAVAGIYLCVYVLWLTGDTHTHTGINAAVHITLPAVFAARGHALSG